MTYADPVTLTRAAITQATALPTTRVLDPAFTTGPMPVIHVHHVGGVSDDIDRTDTVGVDVYHTAPTTPADPTAGQVASQVRDALAACPLDTPAGLVDDVTVVAEPVTRPYFDTVEVSSSTFEITHRPL